MIRWFGTIGKNTDKENDLSVYYGKDGSVMRFKFSQGCVATKFRHAERVELGVDGDASKLYFLPGETGYKLISGGKSGTKYLYVQHDKVERALRKKRAGELIGYYELRYDEAEKAWFVPIGAYQR